MPYQQGDCIRATFRPKRTDDLRPNLEKLIGERIEFCYGWTIDMPGEPYHGQVAWLPTLHSELARYAGMGWVPTEDLEEISLGVGLKGIAELHLTPEQLTEGKVVVDEKVAFCVANLEGVRRLELFSSPGVVAEAHAIKLVAPGWWQKRTPSNSLRFEPNLSPAVADIREEEDARVFGALNAAGKIEPAPPPCMLTVTQEDTNYERIIANAFQVWRATRANATLPAPQEEVDQMKGDLEKLGLKAPTVILDREGNFALLWDRRLSDEEISKVHWYVKRRLGEEAAPSGMKEGE